MSDLDLLIINPGASHGIYGALGDTLIAVEPPLWARLIAGYCLDRGFSVKIVDAEAERFTPEQSAGFVHREKPRLVCIAVYGHQPSASTQQMVGASATAAAIKDVEPEQQIIMVGGHVAALPERTLREEDIDFACNGEGPATIAWLLDPKNQEKTLSECPGLVWSPFAHKGDVVINPSAPLIPVSELHGNAWHFLDMPKYRAHNWQCFGDLGSRQPYASIYTSLGCPYKCVFCCINAPFQTNRYRMRDPKDVVNEIVYLHETYGVKTLKIVDEMFVLNEKHYTAICEGLIAQNLPDLNIWAYARVDTVKPHTLAMFRKAGIRWLALGIESGSAHVRDGADKALRTDDIIGTVRAIQAADINVIGNYIVGLPDDSAETMEETYRLAEELNCEFMNVYSAQAYPGSGLYTQALEQGWTLPKTWAGYSQHNEWCRPLDTRHVAGKDVLRFRDDFFNRYFKNPQYLAMVAAKFGLDTLDHVLKMTEYTLTRKLLAGEIS